MPENDNILYYIVYGIILVAFYIILKSPKKDTQKEEDK
ncbi:hypothetical protein MNB_SV-12-1917 [hydrothermal vent metagenome]|uniref:Uncharacterized protein n=1 Tax=hydrothermal vent metagenome TaxID=652676 RepID=A0A1W1C4Y3_9ZZZZ